MSEYLSKMDPDELMGYLMGFLVLGGGLLCALIASATGGTLLVKGISARAAERAPIGQKLTVRWLARDSVVLKK